MVISRVVKSLIINFSPSLVWLPGAVRSVCVSSVSSAGNIHYMLCYTAYFCEIAKLSQFEIKSAAPKCSPVYFALLGAEDHCPRFWTAVAYGFWKDSSAHPQQQHMGRCRCSLSLHKKWLFLKLSALYLSQCLYLKINPIKVGVLCKIYLGMDAWIAN